MVFRPASLIGAGPGATAPRDPLDARPGRRPLDPQRGLRWLCAGALLASLALSAAAAPPAPRLYLLAATPTSGTGSTYPATLYRAEGGKLIQVRRIFTAEQGLFDVRDDLDGRLYLIDNQLNRVSVIHEAHPAQDDAVTSPQPFSFYWPAYGVVAGAQPSLLMATVKDGRRVITRVLGDASPTQPRISTGAAALFGLYSAFRYSGAIGGPNPPVTPQAIIDGRQIALLDFEHPEVVLALTPTDFKAPPVLPGASLNSNIIAATPRYFAFSIADPDGGPGPTLVYVRDQRAGTWKTVKVPVPAIEPATRIFGNWLVSITKTWIQGQTDPPPPPSPGTENQRQTAAFLGGAQAVPSVRANYALLQQSFYMPGRLVLHNLADGRTITIATGQQDSEVLDVTSAGEVLYRVNNSIYSGHIEGSKLSGVERLVQGENVPEVHWVFYSSGN